jgi:hypothetical protein
VIVDERPLLNGGRDDVFLVTAQDGHLFRCYRASVGGPDIARREWEDRWVFEDHLATYLGPRWFPIATLRQVQIVVGDWWKAKKRSR